jgi:hypothetical protein
MVEYFNIPTQFNGNKYSNIPTQFNGNTPTYQQKFNGNTPPYQQSLMEILQHTTKG